MKFDDFDTQSFEALAELICGDKEPWYRAGWELPEFFQRAGLTCPDHDGTTRKRWTRTRLDEYKDNPNDMQAIMLRLANPKEYKGNSEAHLSAVKKLNDILIVEGFSVSLAGVKPKVSQVEPDSPSPSPDKAISQPPDFDKLTNDPQLASILRNRWKEAQVCSRAGAHLSAIVMMGSVLEGTLLAVVKCNPEKSNKAKAAPQDHECNPEKSNKAKAAPQDQMRKPLSFGDWHLNALIDVAHECGWLQVDVKRFSHFLRESRNIVHVQQQLALDEYPDKDTCNICWEVVQAAVNDLERSIIQP